MADGKLKIDVRRNKILELLRQDGKVLVSQLSKELGITPVTVRNDLLVLEQSGHLIRMQGGAVLPRQLSKETPVNLSEISYASEKQAIAAVVADMIQDGDTLFINSGTTTQFVAEALKKHLHLNVVTNSFAVSAALGNIPTFHVLLLGGEVNGRFGFTSGGDAQEQLHRYQADWAVLAVDGVSTAGGVTTYHVEEAALNRTMIERANCTIVVADHSKIGRLGFTHICGIDEDLCLVTDNGTNPDTLQELSRSGLKIITG